MPTQQNGRNREPPILLCPKCKTGPYAPPAHNSMAIAKPTLRGWAPFHLRLLVPLRQQSETAGSVVGDDPAEADDSAAWSQLASVGVAGESACELAVHWLQFFAATAFLETGLFTRNPNRSTCNRIRPTKNSGLI